MTCHCLPSPLCLGSVEAEIGNLDIGLGEKADNQPNTSLLVAGSDFETHQFTWLVILQVIISVKVNVAALGTEEAWDVQTDQLGDLKG